MYINKLDFSTTTNKILSFTLKVFTTNYYRKQNVEDSGACKIYCRSNRNIIIVFTLLHIEYEWGEYCFFYLPWLWWQAVWLAFIHMKIIKLASLTRAFNVIRAMNFNSQELQLILWKMPQ